MIAKDRSGFRCALFMLLWLMSDQADRLWGQAVGSPSEKKTVAEDAKAYDPLLVDATLNIDTVLFAIEYRPEIKQLRRGAASEEVRKVPVKVYLPVQKTAPVILFSHGLGGSREGFKHGAEHWARRGYVVIALQHPGSDENVWRDRAIGQRMSAMREAANAQNLLLRIEDVKAVIDYLEKIGQGDQSIVGEAKRLQTRMDLKHLGMSGHSFGAITTQMVSGQSPAISTQQPTDARIRAAVVLSPSPPKIGQAERYFSKVSIPWMLMTGTKDNSPIGDQTAESRLQVFPALPVGEKYQVVFEGGTHAFLGERTGLMSTSNEPSAHARSTVGLSTAFWDAYLSEDDRAKHWLDGEGPKSMLSKLDQWQKK